jgi:hypothetical protein
VDREVKAGQVPGRKMARIERERGVDQPDRYSMGVSIESREVNAPLGKCGSRGQSS